MAREHPFTMTVVDTEDMNIVLPNGTVISVKPDAGTIWNYMDGFELAGNTEAYEKGKTWFKTWEPDIAAQIWSE